MRPIIVSILAILIVLVGLLFLFVGIILLIGTGALFFTQLRDLVPVTFVASMLLIVVGGIFLISGVGLWRLRLWAWALALVVVILSLVSEGARFALEGGRPNTFGIILEIVLLIYLLAVRKHFS